MSGFNKFIRFVLIGGSITAAVILILIVIYVRPFLTAGKEVNARIAKLKAEGKPVSVQDLIPPKVPDSQNAAVIYEQIFRKMEDTQFYKDEKIFQEIIASVNLGKDYGRWDEARRISAKYRKLLPLIEEAVAKPECRFNINWDVLPLEIKFPYYDKIRSLNRLISALAIIDINEGSSNSCIYKIKLGLHTGKVLDNTPALTGFLSRSSTVATSCSALKKLFIDGMINESDVSNLFELLSRIDMNKNFKVAMLGEQALGLSMFKVYRNDPVNTFTSLDREILRDSVKTYSPGLFWKIITTKDELFYLESMEKILEESTLPYRNSKPTDITNVFDRLKYPKYAIMSATVIPPVYDMIQLQRDEGTTEIDGSMIALALKAYKSRYGSYPKDLDELRSKLGWEIPVDPFSGKDFIYSKKSGGFLLYSIGPNLKDDGGKVRKKTKEGSASDENYDIVWDVKR